MIVFNPRLSRRKIEKEEADALLGGLTLLKQKTQPLRLRIVDTAPRRVNILIPTIDYTYFFAGYITSFSFASSLARKGHNVRIVTVDPCERNMRRWRKQIRGYQDLENFFDQIEVSCVTDRSIPLEVSPRDVFVATTWWTAHIAQEATKVLKKSSFIYLIQEYEPLVFPAGSFFTLADESYLFPHFAVFSTEFLREWFKTNRLGVFRSDEQEGYRNSVSFQNAITRVKCPSVKALRRRSHHKLLFYARPEIHAARNMFELGLWSLKKAEEIGVIDLQHWEIDCIGSVYHVGRLSFDGMPLMFLPRLSQKDYASILPHYDLGLSLMLSPHPSLVPIEMASAGVLAVTNTFATKTEDTLLAISHNIVPAKPTLRGILNGISMAASRITEYDARVRDSRVDWSRSWSEAFNEEILSKIEESI